MVKGISELSVCLFCFCWEVSLASPSTRDKLSRSIALFLSGKVAVGRRRKMRHDGHVCSRWNAVQAGGENWEV